MVADPGSDAPGISDLPPGGAGSAAPPVGGILPGESCQCLLIFPSRQQGATGGAIGKRTDRGGLGQKHFSEDCAIVRLHPEGSIDSQSMTEDNLVILIIIITRNSRAKCRK